MDRADFWSVLYQTLMEITENRIYEIGEWNFITRYVSTMDVITEKKEITRFL
jgi:hypothetical protein